MRGRMGDAPLACAAVWRCNQTNEGACIRSGTPNRKRKQEECFDEHEKTRRFICSGCGDGHQSAVRDGLFCGTTFFSERDGDGDGVSCGGGFYNRFRSAGRLDGPGAGSGCQTVPVSRSRWQAWRRFMTCTTRRSRPSSSGPSPRRWNFRNKQDPAPSPGRGAPYCL